MEGWMDGERTAIEPKPQEGARWQVRTTLRVLAVIFGAFVTLWLVYELRSVILLLVLSVFFAYLLAPLVRLLQREIVVKSRARALPRGAAIGAVYVALVLGVGLVAHFVAPRLSEQATQLVESAPSYLASALQSAERLADQLVPSTLPPQAKTSVTEGLTSSLGSIGDYARSAAVTLVSLAGYIPWLILVPILGFFLLKDATTVREGFVGLLPRGWWRAGTERFLEDIDATLAAYVRAQLIACLLVGTICVIGFSILGVPFALVLGVLAGVFEFVPLVGPLALACIAAVVAGTVSTHIALLVLGFLAVLRVLEDYVIYPKIIGHGIHMHPLAVIIAVLCGAELGGIAGIFLAVPTMGVLMVVIKHLGGGREIVSDVLEPATPAATPIVPVEARRRDTDPGPRKTA